VEKALSSVMYESKSKINLNYMLLLLIMANSFLGWTWALSIVEWGVNIMGTISITLMVFMLFYLKRAVRDVIINGKLSELRVNLRLADFRAKEPTARIQKVVYLLITLLAIHTFYINELFYTMVVIVLLYTVTHVVSAYYKNLVMTAKEI